MKTLRVTNPKEFAHLVVQHVQKVSVQKEGTIRIGLPGGRGTVPVVEGLISLDKTILKRVELYLVDERLSGSTNKNTLMEVGLKEAIAKGDFSETQLHIPSLDAPFFDFTGSLDLLYLGVGEDGHIGSLFPGSFPALDDRETLPTAYITDSPKPPNERVTVTYRGFRDYAKKAEVYLLYFGEGKRSALDRFLANNEMPSTLPALFFPREWFSCTIVTDIEG